MKIPDKIKISGIEYKIIIKKPADCDLSEESFRGAADYKKCIITISSLYTQEGQERTLLHEILHVIDDDYKIGLSEENIRRITSSLYQVLKENNLLKEQL